MLGLDIKDSLAVRLVEVALLMTGEELGGWEAREREGGALTEGVGLEPRFMDHHSEEGKTTNSWGRGSEGALFL